MKMIMIWMTIGGSGGQNDGDGDNDDADNNDQNTKFMPTSMCP